jgi:hypothetical protein
VPCKSQVDQEHELIHATMSGEMAVDVALQFTMNARRLADKHVYTRLLFDIREFKTRPTTTQIFEMAAAPEKRGLTHDYKRATVVSGEVQARDLDFFVDASVNRGFNVACFTDIKAAVAWLTTD